MGASVGGGSIAVVSVGGYGLYIGRDFHLGSSNIILTPRIGANTDGFVILSADGDGSVSGIAPSIRLETAVCF
ncbi:MAG: hypothetical protein VX278_08045 [Myxococcota bacterium]|nr:hypothetical protein [Myxococcota bacterium]